MLQTCWQNETKKKTHLAKQNAKSQMPSKNALCLADEKGNAQLATKKNGSTHLVAGKQAGEREEPIERNWIETAERERETERHTHAHSLGCFLQKFKVTEMSIYTHKYTLTKNTNRILMEWELNSPKKT